MSNLFDSANYPEKEPTQLVIGDRWVWKLTDLGSDYPPASYSLKYSLRLANSTASEIEIVANESGSDYLVEVPAATTAGYTAGRYYWQRYIVRTSDSERLLLRRGVLDALKNQDAAAVDPRTHARKVLDAIEAVIEGRATKDQEEYSIGSGGSSRSLKRTPIQDLNDLRDKYRAEVDAEERAANKQGGRKVLFRF